MVAVQSFRRDFKRLYFGIGTELYAWSCKYVIYSIYYYYYYCDIHVRYVHVAVFSVCVPNGTQ